MVRAKREDERLLSRDEQHLFAQTRPPIIRKLAGHDLVEVTRQLRECRDRGREAGRYKREELVDRMAASGAATFDSAARRAKDTLLSGALKRANKETERRRVMDTHNANVSNAKHALTTKRAANTDTQWLAPRQEEPNVSAPRKPPIGANKSQSLNHKS